VGLAPCATARPVDTVDAAAARRGLWGGASAVNSETFVDGVINIALVRGMVRIEFGSYSASDTNDDGQPALFSRHQVVMTPQAFLNSFGNMERMLNLLVEKGVLREDADEQRSGPARDTDTAIDGRDRRGTGRDRRKYSVAPR
jgi:hypothetical protein